MWLWGKSEALLSGVSTLGSDFYLNARFASSNIAVIDMFHNIIQKKIKIKHYKSGSIFLTVSMSWHAFDIL